MNNEYNDNTFSMKRLLNTYKELHGLNVSETGPVTKENVFVGARVASAPDWIYGDQNRYDHQGRPVAVTPGMSLAGTVVSADKYTTHGVCVEWDTGYKDVYRHIDLVFFES